MSRDGWPNRDALPRDMLRINSTGQYLFSRDNGSEGRQHYKAEDVVAVLAAENDPDGLKERIVQLIPKLSTQQQVWLVRAIHENEDALFAIEEIDASVRDLLHEIGARGSRKSTGMPTR